MQSNPKSILTRGLAWFGMLSVVSVAVLTACNTLPNSAHKLGECGIGLTIWLRQPKSAQYQYFTVDGGVFAYGAGVTALNLKTSWQTDLSAEQCRVIRQCAQDGGWFTASPPSSTPNKGELIAAIAVSWEDGRQQFVVSGDEPSVKFMTDFLSRIADIRFQRALDRLPVAGEQAK